MKIYLKYFYLIVVKVLSKILEILEKWVDVYRNLNKFLVSEYYENLCEKFFYSKLINCN